MHGWSQHIRLLYFLTKQDLRLQFLLQKQKIVKKGTYKIFDCIVEGYEIHNGLAKKRSIKQQNLYATFVHGLFDSDEFRDKLFKSINKNYKGYNVKKFKTNAIKEFASHIDNHIDIPYIIKALDD